MSTNLGTVTPNSNGGFTATFNVPLSSSNGDQTVKASQGSNSASKTFTVTALVNPIIFLDPSSGPVGTSVNIMVLDLILPLPSPSTLGAHPM